jgi:hypothetical protein
MITMLAMPSLEIYLEIQNPKPKLRRRSDVKETESLIFSK